MLVQLRPSSETFSIPYTPIKRSGRGCPLLRAPHYSRSASKKGTWPLLPFLDKKKKRRL